MQAAIQAVASPSASMDLDSILNPVHAENPFQVYNFDNEDSASNAVNDQVITLTLPMSDIGALESAIETAAAIISQGTATPSEVSSQGLVSSSNGISTETSAVAFSTESSSLFPSLYSSSSSYIQSVQTSATTKYTGKIAATPTAAVKPVINPQVTFGQPTSTPIAISPGTGSSSSNTSAASPTSTSTGKYSSDPFLNFLHSLGTSPTSIALTTIVCAGILALLCATAAFFIRRSKRRYRRGKAGAPVDLVRGTYSDIDSVYSDSQNIHQPAPSQYTEWDDANEKTLPVIQCEDYDDTQLRSDWMQNSVQRRKRSSMDLSLVHHLVLNQPPLLTPSSMQLENSHHYGEPSATVASSPYIEPLPEPMLRNTYLGSFSASVPKGPILPLQANMAPELIQAGRDRPSSLSAPLRPNRPASLTRSFRNAVEDHFYEDSANAPFNTSDVSEERFNANRSLTPASASNTDWSPPVQSAWGVRTISQVLSASADAATSAIKGFLSPSTTGGLPSPSYDEEKADVFTTLPLILPRRSFSRTGSIPTNMSIGAPDRRFQQQMPSRFSVTTLATGSPTPTVASGSIYNDWQLRSILRMNMTTPRRAPELVAQSQPSPDNNVEEDDDSEKMPADHAEYLPVANMQRTESEVDSIGTQSTMPFAYSAPFNTGSLTLQTPTRPVINRYESTRSMVTIADSIYSQHDPEDDQWQMSAEEQRAMAELIRKRREAALAAR